MRFIHMPCIWQLINLNSIETRMLFAQPTIEKGAILQKRLKYCLKMNEPAVCCLLSSSNRPLMLMSLVVFYSIHSLSFAFVFF